MNRMRRLLGGLLAVALSGFLPAIAGCGGAAVTARGPAPVIVDTDMGSDEIMALAYLLKRPGLDIRAVTVEGTGLAHGPAGAQCAAPDPGP
jgi:hypothetical protein